MAGVRTLDRARALIDSALQAHAHDPDSYGRLLECSHRLDEPLRIALAGRTEAKLAEVREIAADVFSNAVIEDVVSVTVEGQ